MTEDEQTIGSWKYSAVQVVPLPSGRFAILGAFKNSTGLPIDRYVEASELIEAICLRMAENLRPEPAREIRSRPAPCPKRNADDILGEI